MQGIDPAALQIVALVLLLVALLVGALAARRALRRRDARLAELAAAGAESERRAAQALERAETEAAASDCISGARRGRSSGCTRARQASACGPICPGA